MSILRSALTRLRALRRSADADRDLDAELRTDVDGLHARERVRDVRFGAAVDAAARDVRSGARVLWRSPGYALVVIMTMTLGIGVNAAIFSVMHAVLWRPLPYPDAARIVAIEADTRLLPSASSASGAVFDVRAQAQLITSIAQIEGRDASLEIDGVMEHVTSARVTDDLLPLLGATPLPAGRPLVASVDTDGVTLSGIVISHELWQRRFRGDPEVIGRWLSVNNLPVRVVGVMPPAFRLVLPAANHVEERLDLVLPRHFAPNLLYRGLPLLGRLAPGATVDQAQAELDALTARFVASHPSAYPRGLRLTVRPLGEVITFAVKPALMALAAAVGFVLLIACVNVANLILARTKTRERELAVRRALGATRLRLMRQLLAENIILSLLGGACGLVVAQFGIDAVDWLRPAHLPRQSEITIDRVVILWTAGLTLVSAAVFGLVPALAFTQEVHNQPLHSGRTGSLHLRGRRLQRGLVVAEVALSIVPLVAAGLMLRTFVRLLDAPIGFEPAHVVTARISLNLQDFSTVDRRSAFYDDAIARVRGLPGVDSASVGGPLPLAPVQTSQRVWPADAPAPAAVIGLQQSVMPGYFGVLGIPLRAGRDISEDDIRHHRRVVVVDERLAALLWRGEAIGKPLGIGEAQQPLEVVGVVGPIRAREIPDAVTPTIYVPSPVYEIEQTLVVKTHAPISTIAPEIKRAVEALGPGRPVFAIQPLEDIVHASIDNTRFAMLVLSGFAIASLVLAGVGQYGTLAYLTSQRTPEFGVRLALGASAAGILRLVIGESVRLTGLGTALGLAGAIALTRALRGLLYEVAPLDGLTIGSVAALLGAVAIVAIGWPAWRASRVDPATALRAE